MIIELFFFHEIKFALSIVHSLMCIFVIHFQWTGATSELPTWNPSTTVSNLSFPLVQNTLCRSANVAINVFGNVYLLKIKFFRLTKKDNIIHSIVYKSQKNIEVTVGLLISRCKQFILDRFRFSLIKEVNLFLRIIAPILQFVLFFCSKSKQSICSIY